SCAYDTVIVIFYNIWRDDAEQWSTIFNALNPQSLGVLAGGFRNHSNGQYNLDSVRDYFRRVLSRDAPDSFTWGTFTSAHAVVDHILHAPAPILSSSIVCVNGHDGVGVTDSRSPRTVNSCLIHAVVMHEHQVLDDGFSVASTAICQICDIPLSRRFRYIDAPCILAFDISGVAVPPAINMTINVAGRVWTYSLRGIIYHGSGHFTARVITSSGTMWYHDGIVTGANLREEATFQRART
ncbi:hypothetical protein BD779DRAFT_1441193, partial [Infundibulicybe gibba]